MSNSVYDLIGTFGAFIVSASLYLQLYKMFRLKSAKDISLSWQIMYSFGLTLIVVYGFGENLWPIYFPTSFECVGSYILLSMKLYYDRKNRLEEYHLSSSRTVVQSP